MQLRNINEESDKKNGFHKNMNRFLNKSWDISKKIRCMVIYISLDGNYF